MHSSVLVQSVEEERCGTVKLDGQVRAVGAISSECILSLPSRQDPIGVELGDVPDGAAEGIGELGCLVTGVEITDSRLAFELLAGACAGDRT